MELYILFHQQSYRKRLYLQQSAAETAGIRETIRKSNRPSSECPHKCRNELSCDCLSEKRKKSHPSGTKKSCWFFSLVSDPSETERKKHSGICIFPLYQTCLILFKPYIAAIQFQNFCVFSCIKGYPESISDLSGIEQMLPFLVVIMEAAAFANNSIFVKSSSIKLLFHAPTGIPAHRRKMYLPLLWHLQTHRFEKVFQILFSMIICTARPPSSPRVIFKRFMRELFWILAAKAVRQPSFV